MYLFTGQIIKPEKSFNLSIKKTGCKMKKICFILAVFLLCSCSKPRYIKPSVYGGNKYDSARAVIVTKDRYVFAGMTQSIGLGGVDMYFMQTDKNGNFKGQAAYGGKGDDRAFAIAPILDKGFMLAGYTTSYGAGNTDVYLVKTDKAGKYVSARVFGGKGFDEAKGICSDGAGGFMIAGSSNSFGKGDYDAYIIRVDSDGNCVWAKTFGGAGNDRINAITPAGSGKFMAVGASDSKSKKMQDIYALVVDVNGKLITENFYGDIYADTAYSAVLTRDGNVVIAGEIGTKDRVSDIALIKTDISGKVLWENIFGGAQADYPSQVIETRDGGLAIAANTESQGAGMTDIYVFKTDKDGKLLWDKVLGGSQDDYAAGIAEDDDGGLVVAGWTRSYGNRDFDVYMVKLDKNGKLEN